MMVFRALAESPCWKNTMLVVVYDEHGGFYDHQAPDPPPENDPQFPTYGVRVPAFVVSPFVDRCTVSHRTFDHTSITRTILERFGVEGAVDRMAANAPRVGEAAHLGWLLTRDPGPDAAPPDYAQANAMLDHWRTGAPSGGPPPLPSWPGAAVRTSSGSPPTSRASPPSSLRRRPSCAS